MQLNMTKGKPLPVILMFTVPLIIGNVFQQLYNMVDTIIVGRYVGADALAAVGSTGTIMFLITGFSQGITAGFSVRVSQKYGARDQIAVKRNVANGILLSIISAVILTVFSASIIETNYPAFTVPRGFKCRNNREINDTHTNLTTSIYCSKPSSITSPVESKRTELRALR